MIVIIIAINLVILIITSNSNSDNNMENLNSFNRYVNHENPLKLILSKNAICYLRKNSFKLSSL